MIRTGKPRNLERLCLLLGILASLLTNQTVVANRIRVEKKCYNHNESIDISFSTSSNKSDDWIALYRTERLMNRLTDLSDFPALWVWTCGTQDCSGTAGSGTTTITFGAGGINEAERDSWPLNAGNYRAVLSGGDQPYRMRAMSFEFIVMPRGQNCEDENEEPAPTPTAPAPAPVEPAPAPQEPTNVDTTDMLAVVDNARSDLEDLLAERAFLGPKFLRLAFHDCVGGCDGCIDFTNPDNAGLSLPIDSLRPLVTQYQTQGLSRTDIWMLAATVAAEVATNGALDFPFVWIGRQTCRQLNDNDCGESFTGRSTSCSTTRGPDRHICSGESGTTTVLDFFRHEFGFTARQTVAIMGAHSIGRMRSGNMGFNGQWDRSPQTFDQGYFVELVGPKDDPIDGAPDWEREVMDNSNINGVPDRHQWAATVDGDQLNMLNSDIALVRQIDEGVNMESNGRVTCPFKGQNRCPTAEDTFSHMLRYRNSRGQFLVDFRKVLALMVDNGYERNGDCPEGQVCRLRVVARR